tara:strand:+ start:1779 stop:2057 length:279 start_codon:yes stop_codon:yes gene_type:complete
MTDDDNDEIDYPGNVVPLFRDLDNDPDDETSPLNTALYAGPTGVFIQQESSSLTENDNDCVALTWQQTQMLVTSLIGLLAHRINGEFNGTLH